LPPPSLRNGQTPDVCVCVCVCVCVRVCVPDACVSAWVHVCLVCERLGVRTRAVYMCSGVSDPYP